MKDLKTRVWGAGKLLLLGGALLATYVVFATASMRLALKSREVQIPDLTNKTANDATAIASEIGLGIHVDETRRLDPKIEVGRVIAQDPAPGTTARAQRSVRIWLSGGRRAAVVPQLTGQNERAAQTRLAQDGLEAPAVSEIRSEAYPSDVVIAQNPAANAPGTRVALLVNRAEQAETFVMPDLIGVNGERAATLLREQGFRASIVGTTPYPGVSAGTVVRQTPQSGFQIAPGDPISIEVSR